MEAGNEQWENTFKPADTGNSGGLSHAEFAQFTALKHQSVAKASAEQAGEGKEVGGEDKTLLK